jgi:hypothetical protein
MNKLTAVDATYHATDYVWDAYPERWDLLIAEGQCKEDAEIVTAAKHTEATKQIRLRAEYHLAYADAALKENYPSEAELKTHLIDAWLMTTTLEEADRQELRANLTFRKKLLMRGSDFRVTH